MFLEGILKTGIEILCLGVECWIFTAELKLKLELKLAPMQWCSSSRAKQANTTGRLTAIPMWSEHQCNVFVGRVSR